MIHSRMTAGLALRIVTRQPAGDEARIWYASRRWLRLRHVALGLKHTRLRFGKDNCVAYA
jgi:hypothetical protein